MLIKALKFYAVPQMFSLQDFWEIELWIETSTVSSSPNRRTASWYSVLKSENSPDPARFWGSSLCAILLWCGQSAASRAGAASQVCHPLWIWTFPHSLGQLPPGSDEKLVFELISLVTKPSQTSYRWISQGQLKCSLKLLFLFNNWNSLEWREY